MEQTEDFLQPATDEQMQAKVDALPNPAPRLTPELIQAVIKDEEYTRLDGSTITVCKLTLQNGFTVLGVNMGPVDQANFDQKVGCEYAYKDAVNKIWQLEGYLLAERLYQEREGGENTKSAAVQVLHVLRQVQDVLRDWEKDIRTGDEAAERIYALLEQPLADWEPSAPFEGATHVANPVHVKAWPITAVHDMSGHSHYREPVVVSLQGRHDFDCSAEMLARYTPVIGDYLVQQEDGYTYLNPKDVFERKYRAI